MKYGVVIAKIQGVERSDKDKGREIHKAQPLIPADFKKM